MLILNKYKMKNKKSQITVELIIVSSLVLGIFLTLFYIIDYRNNEISSTKNFLNAKDTADEIASAINEVYISGFGTRKTMFIVNTTDEMIEMDIRVLSESRLVVVEWENNFYTSPIVTSRVLGNEINNFSRNFSLQSGQLNISNYMGEIRLVQ